MIYKVNCLTSKGKGYKTLKKFKSHDKAKNYFEKMKIEIPGQGYYILKEED